MLMCSECGCIPVDPDWGDRCHVCLWQDVSEAARKGLDEGVRENKDAMWHLLLGGRIAEMAKKIGPIVQAQKAFHDRHTLRSV